MIRQEELIRRLTAYFSTRDDIAFAFLFGSWAAGRAGKNSDLDVAVYFFPKTPILEIEDEVFYKEENSIWADIDGISGIETDLLVLNRAPARIGYTAVTEGISLGINDRRLFWKFTLAAGRLFEEYADFATSFLEVKSRSSSLSSADQDRLLRTLEFIENELRDVSQFADLTLRAYEKDSALRRNVERWIENIVNASIDIAKIIVSSEKQTIPQTYRETILRLNIIDDFDEENIASLSENVRLRNILAHEYLDIRYSHVARFVTHAPADYKRYLKAVRVFIDRSATE